MADEREDQDLTSPDAVSPGDEDGDDYDEDDDDVASTPFDHPLFLPVLLFGLSVWFGFDAFFNDDPDMQEHLLFNQVGFAILLPLTLWFGYKGWKEFQEDREND